ncbi:MAG: DNA sulfur modification protein DndB, partial [Coleofasciculus sp.]
MSDYNLPQSESNQPLDQVLEPYFAKHHRQKCYPGLVFRQGKRQMIQINVPADDLPTLLQAKPSTDNNPDSGKNRPEVKGHTDEIKQYILNRVGKDKPWIVGTLTANVDPEKIEVIELGRGICLVIIPRGVKLDVTDGQHRKRAIHELIESPDGESVADNDFPITLVLEGKFSQCQTDFRDMAQTKALDKSLLLSFGEFEGTVGITKNLIEQVSMFEDKTERIKNSPSTKKKLIYTTNYIAKLVSCAFSNDPNHALKEHDVDQASEALA